MAKPKKPTRRKLNVLEHKATITLWRNATQADANLDIIDPRIKFFFHLGFAISQWAIVERELFHVFRFMLGNAHETTAAFIFYDKHQTIGARFHLTNPLVDALLTKRHTARWGAIMKRFEKEIPTRNRLAHDPSTQIVSSVLSTSNSAPTDVPPPAWEIHLEQTKLLSHTKPKKDRQPISTGQIVDHINEVYALTEDLREFRKKLPKRLPRRV